MVQPLNRHGALGPPTPTSQLVAAGILSEVVKLKTTDHHLPHHSATSCLLELPLAAGAVMAAVGVLFLMEVRRMWEVLCR